jgi:hypothetical protein
MTFISSTSSHVFVNRIAVGCEEIRKLLDRYVNSNFSLPGWENASDRIIGSGV